jgi:hypothetical protein
VAERPIFFDEWLTVTIVHRLNCSVYVCIAGIWRAFQDLFKQWSEQPSGDSLAVWRLLKDNGINLRAFTVILYVLIKAQNKVFTYINIIANMTIY